MCGSSANTSSPAALIVPALQRRDQRRLVDDRAARDVDQRALLAERREHVGVDDVPGRLAARTGDDQEVDGGGQRLEVGEVFVTDVLRLAARVGDLHAHRRDALRRSPCRSGPGRGCRPFCRASLVVSSGPRFSHSPACTKRFRRTKPRPVIRISAERDVGDVVGQHVGRVGHLDAALPAVRDRHAVVADAEHRDDLELGQRVEQLRRRHRAAALHQAADARALGGQQRRLVARLVVVVAAVVGLQRVVEKRRQRCGDEDVGWHGRSRCSVRNRRAKYCSNDAISPASVGCGDDDAREPERARAFGDARMRDERRRRAQAALRPYASSIAQRLSSPSLLVSVTASMRSLAPGLDQAFRAACGPRAAIAVDMHRPARRARAACRPAASRPPPPRKITTRLPAGAANSGNASRPSLSIVVVGTGARRAMPTAASAAAVPGPGREGDQLRRPRRGIADAVFRPHWR